jgi:predicted amino acid racemase
MFLEKTQKENRNLIHCACTLHQKGLISPDTYILDYDMIRRNAAAMAAEAKRLGVKLYFMTKQIGRNPMIAKMLLSLGFDGAVVVDYREAEIMIRNDIPIGNVGHIVQIPRSKLKKILAAEPDTITTYSLEKIKEINQAAEELGLHQHITLRVIGEKDFLYPGQYGGFLLSELESVVKETAHLKSVTINGITSFPCFLYDAAVNDIVATPNLESILKGKEILENAGLKIEEVNLPSATSVRTLELIKKAGGTHGEPGHGLTGTTPYHKENSCEEAPAIIYVSEISHNLNGKSYAYGGGYYPRSHVQGALVGSSSPNMVYHSVCEPPSDNIDYYFTLNGHAAVSDTVLMAFRTQIFVTRSHVAIVKGIESGAYEILGYFDAQGNPVEDI